MSERRSRSIRQSRTSGGPTTSNSGEGSDHKAQPRVRRVKTSGSIRTHRIRRSSSGVGQTTEPMEDGSGDKKKEAPVPVHSWQRSKSPPRSRSGRVIRSSSEGQKTSSFAAMSSASLPGRSLRRTSPTPTDEAQEISIDEARSHAATILERIEQRSSSDLLLLDEDSMRGDLSTEDNNASSNNPNMMSARKKAMMMSASTPGASTSARRKSNLHNSFHSSVAQRFLEHPDDSDGSDEFDLRMSTLMGGVSKYTTEKNALSPTKKVTLGSGIGSLAGLHDSWMGKLSESLHSLRSFAQGDNHDNDDEESSDEDSDFEPDANYNESDEITFEKNVFNNKLRKDLREVDQSVNLMNADAGQYDWSERGNKRKKKRRNDKSMIEWFLTDTTKFPRGKNSKGSAFKAWLNWCCLLTLIFIVASAFMMLPFWDMIFPESTVSYPISTDATTQVNTQPPRPNRPAPVSTNLKSPFHSPDELAEREVALHALLNTQDPGLRTNSVAARKANAWMIAYDSAKLNLTDEANAESILQRYALATFFFVTNPNVPPNTASQTPEPIDQTDSDTNNNIENNNNNNNNRHLSRLTFVDWMSASHVCWWEGLHCNNNQDQLVSKLDLSESYLHGTLPPELGMIQTLHDLDLSHNQFEADIPEIWASSWIHLESLELHDNLLTGTVSTEFCNVKELTLFTTDCDTEQIECECCTECL